MFERNTVTQCLWKDQLNVRTRGDLLVKRVGNVRMSECPNVRTWWFSVWGTGTRRSC